MKASLSRTNNRHNQSRWIVTALLIYGITCIGLLGYFISFPDETTYRSRAENRLGLDPVQPERKQGRYEGVIANWHRYRAQQAKSDDR